MTARRMRNSYRFSPLGSRLLEDPVPGAGSEHFLKIVERAGRLSY